MAPLTQEEKGALVSKVSQELADTRYACSSLTQLTNGTTNFVFRGELARPIHEDDRSKSAITTVIIKHTMPFVATNKDLPLDASRAFYEESMLYALNSFLPSATTAKAPRLHLFIRHARIQILEDFPGAVDLNSLFVSPSANSILEPSVAASIGRHVGSWLRSFYDWALSPNAAAGLKAVGDNEPMRKLKYAITYGSFLKVLEDNFPDLLEGHRPILEQVRDAATREFEKTSKDEGVGKHWGLIHGDFWTGNILVPSDPSLESQHPSGAKLFIVDWEFAQFGYSVYDIGQMIGDIYERKHFSGADGAVSAIEGFIKGYGGLDNELAFRVAIHAGIQMIGWYTRRDPNAPLGFPLEKVTEAMSIGRDWVLKGWQRDLDYFESSPLASLFGG